VAWLKEPLAPWLARAGNQVNTAITVPNGNYTLPEDSVSGCTENTWTATSGPPDGRVGHTAVWTGSQMIVWGGSGNTNDLNTGGRYNPITNSWTATSTINAPNARQNHTAVWTGTTMIIWGGNNGGSSFRTGGKYFPSTNTWVATTMTNAPQARLAFTAIWTGNDMIVWGGSD